MWDQSHANSIFMGWAEQHAVKMFFISTERSEANEHEMQPPQWLFNSFISEYMILILDLMDSHAPWQSTRGLGRRRNPIGTLSIESNTLGLLSADFYLFSLSCQGHKDTVLGHGKWYLLYILFSLWQTDKILFQRFQGVWLLFTSPGRSIH